MTHTTKAQRLNVTVCESLSLVKVLVKNCFAFSQDNDAGCPNLSSASGQFAAKAASAPVTVTGDRGEGGT